ncbi:MAG: hypothetical protein AAF478_01990 [Pseudomonadota bacterium]
MIGIVKLRLIAWCLILLISLMIGAFHGKVFAALAPLNPEKSGNRYELVIPKEEPVVIVVKQDLREFLELAALYNKTTLEFSSDVSGVLINTKLPMKLDELMPELESLFDLKWHKSATKLFVSHGGSLSEKSIQLNGIKLEDLHAAIHKSGIRRDEYKVKFRANSNSVNLIGPASYLDGISEIIQRLKESRVANDVRK